METDELRAAIHTVSMPALDFLARYLFLAAARVQAEHAETARLLTLFREVVDNERERRLEFEHNVVRSHTSRRVVLP
jgi:hypothetical protein